MAAIFVRFLAWLVTKALFYVAILAVLLGVFVIKAVPEMVMRHHEKQLEIAIQELDQTRALVGSLAERAKIESEKLAQKLREIEELNRKRQELESWIQQIRGFFHKSKMESQQQTWDAQEKILREELRLILIEKEKIQTEGGVGKSEIIQREILRDEKLRQLREIRSLRDAMDELMRNEIGKLASAAFMIFLALLITPLIWKWLAYYLIAPLAESAEAILLEAQRENSSEIIFSESHPAQRFELKKDEVLSVKADYLQGSLGSFEKRTEWMFDRKYPLSCLAAGLYLLTRVKNQTGHFGQITLSAAEDATEELASVFIPEGNSMCFRPQFLVGVVHSESMAPRIRSHWVFGKLQSWLHFRFRHLIVDGPVTLFFAAQRGVQTENVTAQCGGRRINANLTVAYKPSMMQSSKRAETFIAYFRGKNALFDDYFQGQGYVIQQQVLGKNRGTVASRVWERMFNALGKVFGI